MSGCWDEPITAKMTECGGYRMIQTDPKRYQVLQYSASEKAFIHVGHVTVAKATPRKIVDEMRRLESLDA